MSHGRVLIADPVTVKEKIRRIVGEGPDHLQVMTDFDQTLTKHHYTDGKKADSSFRAIQDSVYIPESVKKVTRQLFEKYHPIELDTEISRQEKEKHMIAWWEGNMELFKELGIRKDDFGRIVLESRLLFRYGILDFLSHCHRMNLPLYIVSGGISEIIEATFYAVLHSGESADPDLKDFWHKRVQVLSNSFIYSDSDVGIDYSKPLVHILNKEQIIYDVQADRPFKRNVIIMGDILEDVKMVREHRHEVHLKIGFLNDAVAHAHLKEEFMRTFDIVVEGDGSLEVVNHILKRVMGAPIECDDTLKAVL